MKVKIIKEKRREKDWCDDKKIMDKIKCHDRDNASRAISAKKRKRREEILPAYDEMLSLGRGVVEEEPEHNNFDAKWKNFINTLNRIEKATLSKNIKKPTTNDLFRFCNNLNSAAKGSLDDDARKAAELRLKAAKG